MLNGPTPNPKSRKQIGQRLASPNSTDASVNSGNTSKSIKDDSPIAALVQNASFGASVCESSVISTFDEESQSLNEGFIMTDEKEMDISRIMSEPALAGSHDPSEYVMLGDVHPRETSSDTTILADSRYETPRAHSRSLSVDSILDSSAKKSSLRRGRPNSLKAGLLQGDQKEVQKLRRSFGLDKSDIGFPVPVSVADTSNCDRYIQLNSTLDDLIGSQAGNDADVSQDNLDREDPLVPDPDSPGSVSRNKVSRSSVANSVTGYECDDECSEVGFPTKGSAACPESSQQSVLDPSVETTKTLAEQKQESKDSLLSTTSASLTPPVPVRDREMTRSVSADSGKGSLCEEPVNEEAMDTTEPSDGSVQGKEGTEVPGMSVTSATMSMSNDVSSLSECNVVKATQPDTSAQTSDRNETINSSEHMSVERTVLQSKKSVSSQDLTKDFVPTPVKVARSKSLLETSLSQRKQYVKPNLQISAETHKLLARAGYIKGSKSEESEEMDDFPVTGSLKFPVIKQAETINPRRESIIALRKNNAGYVRSNVKQFDQIGTEGVDTRHTSPLRFPNSTTRRKGMTQVKIPTAFSTVEGYQEEDDLMKDKLHAGVARVPISTQLIKPSSLVSGPGAAVNEVKTDVLKRKPSVYYADRDSVMAAYRARMSKSVCEKISEERISEEMGECDKDLNKDGEAAEDLEHDDVFVQSESVKCDILSEDVGEKNAENKENAAGNNSADSSVLLTSIPVTPIHMDTSALRTASNKTPVEILKAVKSQRSPVKPLKRLRSPHSPRCRGARSPKLVRNQALLSATASPMDELNNL